MTRFGIWVLLLHPPPLKQLEEHSILLYLMHSIPAALTLFYTLMRPSHGYKRIVGAQQVQA